MQEKFGKIFCQTFSFSFKIGHIWSVKGKAKQFCFAKEMKSDWMKNKPYMKERGMEDGRDADY